MRPCLGFALFALRLDLQSFGRSALVSCQKRLRFALKGKTCRQMNLAKLLPLRAAMRQVTETIKRKRIKEKENKSEKTRERERGRERQRKPKIANQSGRC